MKKYTHIPSDKVSIRGWFAGYTAHRGGLVAMGATSGEAYNNLLELYFLTKAKP